jgi:parvulin-like peptidyl-prolyl isomerase
VRTPTRLAGMLAGALLLAACGGAAGGGTPAGAAAVVNGTEIPLDTVEERVQAQVAEAEDQLSGLSAEERNERVATLQRNVLSGLISVTLLEQLADERGLDVSDEDVEQLWQSEIEGAGGEEELRDLIESLGLTEEQARRQLRARAIQNALRDEVTEGVEVSDEDVQALYDERGGDQERVIASHILVDTEEEANEVLQLLEDGGSFEDLARERSSDTGSAQNGGQLPPAAQGDYVPEFDEAVWNAEEGELVGPVETQFGFHVIRVDEFTSGTFADQEESLREELAGTAAQEELRTILTSLFSEADVTVAARFGEWDPVAGQVVAEGQSQPAPEGSAPADQ